MIILIPKGSQRVCKSLGELNMKRKLLIILISNHQLKESSYNIDMIRMLILISKISQIACNSFGGLNMIRKLLIIRISNHQLKEIEL